MRVLVVLVAACAPPVLNARPDGPPIADPVPAPLVYTAAHPAEAYNEPAAEMPADPLADQVFAGLVIATRGRGILARDPRLDVACAELAATRELSDGVVEFALHSHGVVEHAVATATSSATAPAQIVDELARGLGDKVYFGNVRIGIGGHDPVVAIATYTPKLVLATTPRRVPPRSSFELAGTFAAGLGAPEITVTRADAVEHPKVTVDGNGFHATIACPFGDEYVAIAAAPDPGVVVPISCGAPPPGAYRFEPPAGVTATDRVRRLISIINRERRDAGLDLLHTDARATAAADRYAAVLRRTHRLGHDVDGSAPVDRLRDAGVVSPFVRESTLRARDLAHAAELLLNDATYHDDLVSPEITHLGVSIVEDAAHELYVAIDYIQVGAVVDIVATTKSLATKVLELDELGRRADDDLAAVARWYAGQLALGWNQAALHDEMRDRLRASSSRFGTFGISVRTTFAPSSLDVAELVGCHRFTAYGVGVAQGGRDGAFAGKVTVVIVLATPSLVDGADALRGLEPCPR